MKTTREIPFVHMSGSPKERGVAHGTAVAPRIVENIAFYKRLLKLDENTRVTQSNKFASIIESFNPALKEEMDGIAEGAKVEAADIYMLNARTELLSMSDVVQSECATFFFGKSGLLFENWDWSEPSKDKTVLLSIELPNGNKILTFTEAGMLGKVGMSSAGFGVAFNYLYPAGVLDGVPVHALLRTLLEADSFKAAVDLLTKSQNKGTSGNILLADATGQAIDFELSGSSTSSIPMIGDSIAHTNHYLGGTINEEEAGMGFLNNSYDRYTRAETILKETTQYGVAEAKKILTDRAEGTGMLCRDFIPEEPGHTPTGTIASMIMDIPNKTLHITLDPQETGTEFVTYIL